MCKDDCYLNESEDTARWVDKRNEYIINSEHRKTASVHDVE